MNQIIDAARRALLVAATTVADAAEHTAAVMGAAAERLYRADCTAPEMTQPSGEDPHGRPTPGAWQYTSAMPDARWGDDPMPDAAAGQESECDFGTWVMRFASEIMPGQTIRIGSDAETVADVRHGYGDGYLGHVVHLHLLDDGFPHTMTFTAGHPLLVAVSAPADARELAS